MAKILVVDDDTKLLKMLERTLRYEGYEVLTAQNGIRAIPIIDDNQPDLIVLDWTMPEMDGVTLLRQLRSEKNAIPVLMLTARDAVENRVEGLYAGADDYLIKPFAPEELAARVQALLRRTAADPTQTIFEYLDIRLDMTTREVTRDGELLNLTLTEFNLLACFLRQPKVVIERAALLRQVWGYDFMGEDNVLELYVGYLRKKLEQNGSPRSIQTVRGVGYAMREK